MKQEEKTKRTQERILKAAITEFSTKGYDIASLNNICAENNISKGLIYHNFKGKDELYLECLKKCFQELTNYLKDQKLNWSNAKGCIQHIFSLRQEFFDKYPEYRNLFFYSILQPPQHLQEEITEIRREFDDFNKMCIRNIIHLVKLRNGITEETALEYFLVFGELFNVYFQKSYYGEQNDSNLMRNHDEKLSDILSIMLYGIAEEKEEVQSC